MPADAKPLFRPDVLGPKVAAFPLPASATARRPKLGQWAELFASGRAERIKESELLPDFLTDFFLGLLGYVGRVEGGDRYTFSREKHVEVDGKYADAVLGDFTADRQNFTIALEGKGPRDPLDRPFAGRRMSAVDQGYRYAINLPCDWIIVTSMRQTRLYYKGAGQHTYERFDIERLAADEATLRKFVFLLGAERVTQATGKCHLYDLLAASEKVGRDVTKEFYVNYADLRHDTFLDLCQANPEVPPSDVLTATQKALAVCGFLTYSILRQRA